MTSTTQMIPNACWTQSIVHPEMWVYQDSGASASIDWRDDDTYVLGVSACWRFATGAPPPDSATRWGSQYGTAVMTGVCGRTDPDGNALPTTIVVEHADDTIGITQQLFADMPLVDGLLLLDTAGTYRYRPVRTDLLPYGGRIVVCHREHPPGGGLP